MAEACPGNTKSSLEDIQAWHSRDETYSRPCRAGERAGETTTGGILGRRDNTIISRVRDSTHVLDGLLYH